MTVLVLAEELDPTADQVIGNLDELGVPVFRCDTAWFPQRLSLGARLRDDHWVGQLRTPEREAELVGLRSVWYRSPTAFRFPAGMSSVERRHAEREARLGLGGVLASLGPDHQPSRQGSGFGLQTGATGNGETLRAVRSCHRDHQ